MNEERKRFVEVRLIVIVVVDITDPELEEALRAAPQPSAVDDIVSSEVMSNLESIRYAEAVIVSWGLQQNLWVASGSGS